METTAKKSFGIYRFQIVPFTLTPQLRMDLFESYEELIVKKNTFFANSYISDKFKILYTRGEMAGKKIYDEQDGLLLRIGKKKDLLIPNREFETEKIEEWPNLLVFINNDPDVQFALIEKNPDVCYSTDVIAKILEKTFTHFLRPYNLVVYFEPVFSVNEFWDIVNENKFKLTHIEFELIKPNLSNISSNLADDIKAFQESTNGHRMTIGINAPESGILENINEGNDMVKNIVEYQSQGGGKPSIKLKNVRKIIRIGKTVKETHIEEADITYERPSDLFGFMKNLTS
jgi:hypothetical protein